MRYEPETDESLKQYQQRNTRECMGGPWDGSMVRIATPIKIPADVNVPFPALFSGPGETTWAIEIHTPYVFKPCDFGMNGVYVLDEQLDVWEWVPMAARTGNAGAG